MTSWLNTKGLTQLAKSALNEAQKTLDKALEAPEETLVTTHTNDEVKTNLPQMWSSFKESLLTTEVQQGDKEVESNESADDNLDSSNFVNPTNSLAPSESDSIGSHQDSLGSSKEPRFVESTLTTTSALDASLLEEAMNESVRVQTSSASSPKSFDVIASNESNDNEDSDLELMTKPGSTSSSVKSMERTRVENTASLQTLALLQQKLNEASITNNSVQSERDALKHQLNEAKMRESRMDEMAKKLEMEWSQRCNELEKKIEDYSAQNEKLLQKNKVLEREASSRMSQSEISSLLAERDEIISELRTEGENLAKEVAKHSEITRKLRQKERGLDKELKSANANLETTKNELESTKQSLKTKESSEKKCLQLIEELRSANSAFETEHNRLCSDLEDAQAKGESLKTSLESAYKEIGELKRAQAERDSENQSQLLIKAEEEKAELETRLRELAEEYKVNELALHSQLEDLRQAQSDASRESLRKQDELRREREEIQRRLEESEQRHEDLSNNIAATTKPLLRQIESLQASLNESQLNSERVERTLSERLQQTSTQLATISEQERVVSQELIATKAKVASLEKKCETLTKERDSFVAKLDEFDASMNEVEELKREKRKEVEATRQRGLRESNELRRENDNLRYETDNMKLAVESERKKALSLMEQLTDRDNRIREMSTELDALKIQQQQPIRASPLAQFSLEPISSPSPFNMRRLGSDTEMASLSTPTTAAAVESLQALLKQREGELSQLQLELSQLQRSRDSLRQEVTRLTHVSDQIDAMRQQRENLEKRLQELETRYQTLLTMYGEKSEEAEELRLDLSDVKEMYKTQIDELLQRSN